MPAEAPPPEAPPDEPLLPDAPPPEEPPEEPPPLEELPPEEPPPLEELPPEEPPPLDELEPDEPPLLEELPPEEPDGNPPDGILMEEPPLGPSADWLLQAANPAAKAKTTTPRIIFSCIVHLPDRYRGSRESQQDVLLTL